jgi:Ni,Fe-hydrogenase III large subunit/Ni,Fe-hydrogenase III component G
MMQESQLSSGGTWLASSAALSGAPNARRVEVPQDQWRGALAGLAAARFRLLALWTDAAPHAAVHVVLAGGQNLLRLDLPLPAGTMEYADIADLFPAAARMQRAAADLTGIRANGGDSRPWLRHAAWPETYLPLVPGSTPPPPAEQTVADSYPFVRVGGDGVHEIPVGPVHAGIIEPGHFRFSVVGEKVLRLEERLGYVHKGIEQRFSGLPLREGHRLAARISGDSAVAFSWAYVQALEGMAGASPPPRALWLRALALESERIANHLGDLGALGNDAGFAFGLTQFSRLKELWLRALEPAFGQRYLLDYVVPGGVARDIGAAELELLANCAQDIAREAQLIRSIYDEHAGVRDRFTGTGIVEPELALRLGMTGLAARASGQPYDLRVDAPTEPYAALGVRAVCHENGDVAARVAVRFDELGESARLVARIASGLPAGAHKSELSAPGAGAQGLGAIEGWRGPTLVALTAGTNGAIARCHPHDPSWLNWPLLEHAVIGNIVPDFPLINKSFNLSYSGADL